MRVVWDKISVSSVIFAGFMDIKLCLVVTFRWDCFLCLWTRMRLSRCSLVSLQGVRRLCSSKGGGLFPIFMDKF